MISKQETRAKLKSYRMMFTLEQWDVLSDLIQDQFIGWLSKSEFRNIGIYLESSIQRELSTKKIIAHLMQKKLLISVPKVISENGDMIFVNFDGSWRTEINKWGVLEPIDSTEVSKHDLDMLIVPMLGGDKNGSRIGYGKGFYDRYLADFTGISVGLCPTAFILSDIPVEIHDKKLDFIITESEIIRIAKQ
jgi:5-formyltetrahydrofolate cyclo-ligase